MIDDMFGELFDNFNEEEKWFTLSNLSTVIAITSIDHSLERYKDHINIIPEYRPRMNMKNEYLFKRFLLTSRKKNYVGSIKLKEGGVYENSKLDIKGLSFSKSNFNKELCDNVEDLVKDIMMDEEISLQKILSELRNIDEKVESELKSDKAIKYFDIDKVSDDPGDLPIYDHRVNAVNLWNFIGNGDEIELPAAFYTAHLDLSNIDKIKEKYPERFKDLTEYLLDKMHDDNLHKLKEYQEEYEDKYNINLNEVLDISLEEDYWFKGFTEIKDGSVHLYISKNTKLDAEVNQYILQKFKNKFRRSYDFTAKDKKSSEKMNNNMVMFTDGEHCIIKVDPIFDRDVKRMELDVLGIYANTFRLVINEFMDKMGEKIVNYIEDKNGEVENKDKRKLGRIKAIQKRYRDLNKLALPLEVVDIPDFILDFINIKKYISQTSNLISPVIQSLNLKTYRDSNKRQHVTNIIDYY